MRISAQWFCRAACSRGISQAFSVVRYHSLAVTGELGPKAAWPPGPTWGWG